MPTLTMPSRKQAPKKDRHLRKQSNVRLSDAARGILAEGVIRLGLSQAGVMELALRELAKREGFDIKPATRQQSAKLIEEELGPSR